MNKLTEILDKNINQGASTDKKEQEAPAQEQITVDESKSDGQETNNSSDKDKEYILKKNSLQARINQKHAEAMQYKDQLTAALAKIDVYEKQAQQKPEVKQEEEELVFEDVEALEKFLKNVVTKKDMETTITRIVEAKLRNARETLEKEKSEQRLATIQQQFNDKLCEYYQDKADSELGFNDETKKEALEIYNLFNTNPVYYEKIVKKHGIGYLKKFIFGEFDDDAKAEKIKNLIDKSEAIKVNSYSHNNVQEAVGRSAKGNLRGKNLLLSIFDEHIKRKKIRKEN